MSLNDLFMITPYAALSGFIWVVLIVALLYVARAPAHDAIRAVSRMLHNSLRVAARAAQRGESRLAERNREVLLAAGREAKERIIEREFDRIGASVSRDLAHYPTLNRSLSEAITRIESDHAESTVEPPAPPAWIKAVEAVVRIPSQGDAMVGQVLEEIRKSLIKAQETAIAAYRDSSRERHAILARMRPAWRRIQSSLTQVDRNIQSLLERSRSVDRHMAEYAEIIKGTERAVATLSSSSLVHFFISLFVLCVAAGGAAINFSLIARPMAEMVGGTNFIGSYRAADIAALVIILVEISMGLFLMESLRITRLFPVIGALADKTRVRMVWITFVVLFLLASVEAGLAYMREILLQDELATSAMLRGDDAGVLTAEHLWITTAAQMMMGFILPFALVFVAIPLETFVHSLRTVLGLAGIGALRLLAALLRVLGNLARFAGTLLEHLYDLAIFLPLWVEHMVLGRGREAKPASDGSATSDLFPREVR
ncbi:MAG: hypothetical protein ACREVN_11100 [Gammaproteobacteria bacterium]